MRDSSKFRHGSGCFTCKGCGRKTRENGSGNSDCELCPECFEASGIENHMADNGETPEMLAEWQRQIDLCISKGGKPTDNGDWGWIKTENIELEDRLYE
jgi:hypothetical protein